MSQRKANYTARKFYDPIDDVLDRPIAFNPAFKKITGSTVAALMLSQAYYWSKRTDNEDGWFYKTVAEWEDETGLTRSEQETARKHLKGILEVDLRGVPATLYYRIDRQKIKELLGIQFAGTLQTEIAGTPQTSTSESSEQDSDIPANINSTENTTETTQGKKAKFSNPLWDLQHGELPQLSEEDVKQAEAIEKVEEVIQTLERGLRVNISRTTNNQAVAKRLLKDARPLERFLQWVHADEWRAAHTYLYAELERVWRDFPQAFPAIVGMNTDEQKGSFYG